VKSKKEIIEEIVEEMRVSKEAAKELFDKAMENGDIKRVYDWKKIVDMLIIILVIVAGIYAIIKIA
jgi:hypothetical protein|tara:strand:+ start:2244 stop:2441 length:198 start_codon:yes stop_codon:yes gene_type:complete